MKLSKAQAKQHQAALDLVRRGTPLTEDEKDFILEHYHEGATHMNGAAGAIFTPMDLAYDFTIEVPRCRSMVDLCAGIGRLAYASRSQAERIVCVEINPEYVEVGRAVLPEATWVLASVFDVDAYAHLGPFDVAISNPPFGKISSADYRGPLKCKEFEFRVMHTASTLARYGVFILPQLSAPYWVSGRTRAERSTSEAFRKFEAEAGFEINVSCLDTSVFRSLWRNASPHTEVVCCSFETTEPAAVPPTRREPAQLDLLAAA